MNPMVLYFLGALFTVCCVACRQDVATLGTLVRFGLLWPLVWATWVVKQCGKTINEVINS